MPAALLDTGALELLRRRDRRVETLALRYYPPLICPHIAGEFLFGQLHARVSANALTEVKTFLESFEMLVTTDRDFRHISELKVHYILPDPA